ncbi:MAG: penicillin-binding protein 1C [Cognaticolwellia sp.]
MKLLTYKIKQAARTKRFWLSTIIAGMWLLFYGLHLIYPLNIPKADKSFAQVVYANDGRALRAFADNNGIWRQQTDLKSVSPLYIQALFTYEDQYFWSHFGVNPVSLLRAMYLNWRCGCIVSGGSTLSMQVARILHPHSRTFSGKLIQILRTLQLELSLSKEEILTLYLNYAPFGGTVEGVEAASQAYLGKSAQQLSHAEAALLTVLPQSPSRIRPDRYPHRAEKARNKVLKRLASQQVWSDAIIKSALQEQVYAAKPSRPNYAPLLSLKLIQEFPLQKKIISTIDYDLQIGLEDHLKHFISSQPDRSSAAVLVLDNKTGTVKAYIGSADFNDKSRFSNVDMISAIRSPGSTLKPFIYASAIDKGLIHSHSLLNDSPRYYSDYKPENFTGQFSGPVSVQSALQRSLNVPAVQVLEHLGPQNFYNQLASAGIKLILPKNAKPNLSIALGGSGISLWQLVQAYSSMANQGKVLSPRYYDEADNKPNEVQNLAQSVSEEKPTITSRYLMSESAAWITYKMLLDNPRPNALLSENIRRATNDIAWKTGTSYGFRDAWAIGTSAKYTIGVWLGRPDGTPQPGHYGGLTAAPLLFNISDALHQNKHAWLKKPEKVSTTDICWPLGKSKKQTVEDLCHVSHKAYTLSGLTPNSLETIGHDKWQMNPQPYWQETSSGLLTDFACPQDKVKRYMALWPKSLEPWLPKKFTRAGMLPKKSKHCTTLITPDFGDIKIVGLAKNTEIITLSIDKAPLLNFSVLGSSGQLDWYHNGNFVKSLGSEQTFFYAANSYGEQQIAVVDSHGNNDMITFQISGSR